MEKEREIWSKEKTIELICTHRNALLCLDMTTVMLRPGADAPMLNAQTFSKTI